MRGDPPLRGLARPGARVGALLRSPLAWGLLLHAASRVVFYRLGIRFDVAPLFEFWQFVDPALLRDDLARSLFYLHSQPPLFNALLGMVLKLAPRGAEHAAGNLLELGENNRFRFAIDPLIWAAVWGWADARVRHLRGGMLRGA